MLNDLDDGLKGAKNITDEMEKTSLNLFLNKVPMVWGDISGTVEKGADKCKRDLATWFEDLLLRI